MLISDTKPTYIGHGFSMSRARYEFDLSLLYQDLPRYSHDPHIDYYLGITHHAHLESLLEDTNEINRHDLENSLYFLEKRATSVYPDDFIEERWASMYLLGTIYHKYLVSVFSVLSMQCIMHGDMS